MANTYWKSLEARDRHPGRVPDNEAEHVQDADREPSRRDFLRLAGFSAAAIGTSCSRAPVKHAVPLVVQPEGFVPGATASYATTCQGCAAGCGLLVTSRDGRPTKVEGLPEHPLSAGGTCALAQASLAGLYDNRRFRRPSIEGRDATWAEADAQLTGRFDAIRKASGAVRVLTPTVHSPTLRQEIEGFLATFADGVHVEYDALSASAALDAHLVTHGLRALPRYRFDRADVVAGLDADFLGTWVAPVEYASAYARRRAVGSGHAPMWHAQVESRVTITGGKADRRIAVAPDEIPALVFDLLAAIEGRGTAGGDVAMLAERLLAARGRALVIAGSQDLDTQIRCNRINAALGAYGATLDLDRPSYQRRGDDRALRRLLDEAAAGQVAALVVWRANPFFDLPDASALARVPLLVSLAERPDETTAAAHAICPDHHPFESWGDSGPVAGLLGTCQPLVRPLGETRGVIETLAAWRGRPAAAHDLVRERWRAGVWPRQQEGTDFERFWSGSVQRGFVTLDAASAPAPASSAPSRVPSAPARESAAALPAPSVERPRPEPGALTLVLYNKTSMPGGEHAWNPLLQELPDPVSKVVWDNYAAVSPAIAARQGLATGDLVRVETEGGALTLPVLVQPGQHERTVAVALGYGGLVTERFRDLGRHWFRSRPTVGEQGRVGVNAAPLLRWREGRLEREVAGVRLVRANGRRELACTQEYHSLAVPAHLVPAGTPPRPIVQEISRDALMRPDGAAHGPSHEMADLWPEDHPATGHRWGMAIDLDACTGCGACVVACQVENNVPVVGLDEVRRNREMHWLRIDRYYTEDDDGLHMAHQPMLCQHCGHAPCETVCPTLATVHSAEGLNQQVYNRCVGTRYCANNCPFKARRFNWFAYPHGEGTETLGLNPVVTVRTRGVMEKCTMCVHRIQEGKIAAKSAGTRVGDGDIRTACQQSCPTRAITFGDLNDPSSAVARLSHDRRGYVLLEELNVQPSVTYLKIVRQGAPTSGETGAAEGSGHHG